jgi:hypothetical protein
MSKRGMQFLLLTKEITHGRGRPVYRIGSRQQLAPVVHVQLAG